MNPVKTTGGKRLLYLESARGLAALSVMIQHFIVSFRLIESAQSHSVNPVRFFYYGEAAVLFFFVHSGFILCYSLHNRLNKTGISASTRLTTERIFRIYPLFIFIVLLSYLLKKTIFPLGEAMYTTMHLQGFWSKSLDVKELVNELSLIHSVSQEGTRRLIPQEWTAAVEIVWGCWIPFLLFFLKKIKRSWMYWLVIIISIKILDLSSFIFDFALGVYLFYHMDRIKAIWQKTSPQMKWILFGLVILFFTCFFSFASLFSDEKVFTRPGVDHVIVSLGCGFFFCILLRAPTLQKLFSYPVLVADNIITETNFMIFLDCPLVSVSFYFLSFTWFRHFSYRPLHSVL
jgi:peptidoglycan/LPS O-acetylase OafA/YrhL